MSKLLATLESIVDPQYEIEEEINVVEQEVVVVPLTFVLEHPKTRKID
jgi:hypothetical protein